MKEKEMNNDDLQEAIDATFALFRQAVPKSDEQGAFDRHLIALLEEQKRRASGDSLFMD